LCSAVHGSSDEADHGVGLVNGVKFTTRDIYGDSASFSVAAFDSKGDVGDCSSGAGVAYCASTADGLEGACDRGIDIGTTKGADHDLSFADVDDGGLLGLAWFDLGWG